MKGLLSSVYETRAKYRPHKLEASNQSFFYKRLHKEALSLLKNRLFDGLPRFIQETSAKRLRR